jgi:hypothetical protein
MENILNKKLHLKPGLILAVINAPEGYLNKLQPLPENVTISNIIISNCDFIQYFVSNIADLEKALPVCKKAVKQSGSIWISYQKQSSKVKTDLNRDISFPILEKYGFMGVTLISIDETWSAFRIKPVTDNTVKKSVKDAGFKKYIDKENRIITPPEDLQKELKKSTKAAEFFNTLAFSNKKEYVQWILDAKREDTRNKRVRGTIAMLLKALKNPFDKSGK